MIRWTSTLLAIVFLVFLVGLPAQAQNSADFFDSLQGNLSKPTSTDQGPVPQSGTSETVITTTTAPVNSTATYNAYDAGQDHMSGYLAGVAAVVAALAVAFALGFILTHHQHAPDNDQSQ